PLPPGNSHTPAIDFPGGRWASNTRPSASTSAAAATSTSGGPSAAVAGIDVDVAVGQIAGPHRRLAAADTDIDGNVDVAPLHVLGDGCLVVAGIRAAP